MSNVSALDGLSPDQFHLITFGEKGDRSGIDRGSPSYPDRAWEERGERVTLPPTAALSSSQAVYEPRKVDKFMDPSQHRGAAKVYEHSNGERVIVDGHHRLIADRLSGRASDVNLVRYDPARDGDWR